MKTFGRLQFVWWGLKHPQGLRRVTWTGPLGELFKCSYCLGPLEIRVWRKP